jgi:predicted MFS family arabinose efflux permease
VVLEPVARIAPETPRGTGRVDWRGAALAGLVTTGVVLLLQSPATKAGPVLVVGAVVAAVLGAVLLRAHVARRPNGFLPTRVIGNRNVMMSSLTGMTFLAAYLGMILAVPLLFTEEQGWRPLQIGLAMLPAALVGAVASRVVGETAARLGRYRVAAWLAAGSCAGLLLGAVGHRQPVLLVACFAAVACGFAAGQVALIDGIAELLDDDVQGVGLGVFNLIFFTGGAVGAALVGGIGGATSLPVALACLAVLPLVGALSAALVDRRVGAATRPLQAEA